MRAWTLKPNLADALLAIELWELAHKAREGYYHDFHSPLDTPQMQLIDDLTRAAMAAPDREKAIFDLRARVIDGEFDASVEEGDEWAASEEEQALNSVVMETITEPHIDEEAVRRNAVLIYEAGRAARERNVLSIWTVYDHPKDYPGGFIARRFEAGGSGPNPVVTADVVTGDLGTIRESMAMVGLYCMARAPADDPVIVETWL